MSALERGLINKMLARWTAAKAAFLDAAITSRAAASTALSSAVWTSTKAGYLDQAISESGAKPPTALIGVPAVIDVSVINVADSYAASTDQAGSTYNVWVDIISYTGSGTFDFLMIEQNGNASNLDVDARLMIDGTEVWIEPAAWVASADDADGFVLVGAGGGSAGTDPAITFAELPFKTSFALQFRKAENAAGTITMQSHHRYRKES